jgi:PAS domain S-box-containing protein
MKGVVVVTAIEAAILLFMSSVAPFTSITPEPWQTISITLFALLAFGYLVTQLTRGERQEKNSLLQLRLVSDKERSRLLALVDSLHVAILVTNQKGKIIQHNEAARDLAGISARLSGNRIQDEFRFFRRDDPKKKPVYLFNDDDIGQHRRDLSIMTRENTRLDLDITVTPVWHDGINTEYIVVCEDISKERPLEELRSSFISVASHELRTPIAVIEAALQSALISKESLAPQIAAIIEQAHRSTLHLSDIVKDLSLLAEAENDTLPVNLTQINPDQLLTQCVADFSSQVNQKGLKLKKVVEKGTPSVLSTEHHIREILQNLVTNALKYSEKGTVTLKAEPASNGGVRFSVQDQGVGIEPGDQKFLFTKFFRAENYLTQSTSGTGLGLYLCMELADRLGARIWFKSAPRKGSTFYLEVPAQNTTSRSSLIETADNTDGKPSSS